MKNIPYPGVKIQCLDMALHLNCSGPETNTRIIIEAGGACVSSHYAHLYNELAKYFKVYSYDRAGQGWSDASKAPRNAETIATELYHLIKAANIHQGPIVLVGHSMASLFLRVFAHKFPDCVSAIVLLDPSHPDQQQVLGSQVYTSDDRKVFRRTIWSARLGLTGLYNPLFTLKSPKLCSLPDSAKLQLAWLYRCSRTYITNQAEISQFSNSAEQALSAPDFGAIPLKVITAPADMTDPEKHSKWLDLQADIATWSRRSEHQIIKEAGHMTLFTIPHHARTVAAEIRTFTDQYGINT